MASGLEHSARALGSARRSDQVVDALVLGTAALGAAGVSLGLAERHDVATVSRGFDDERVSAYLRIPRSARLPGPDVLRTGSAAYFPSADAAAERYPAAAALLGGSGYEGAACIPMHGPAGPLGYLAVHYTCKHDFSETDKAVLALLTAMSTGVLLRLGSARHAPPSEQDLAQADPTHHPGPEILTSRELEILELIAAGLTNREICERLYLSINSVKTYIRSAYRKIGVGSRSKAVLWGVSHGLAAGSRMGG